MNGVIARDGRNYYEKQGMEEKYLAEELVEGVLCFEGDVARLTHPHTGQPVGAGPALVVGVAEEGLQPLQPVPQHHHVVSHLQQHLGLARCEPSEL